MAHERTVGDLEYLKKKHQMDLAYFACWIFSQKITLRIF